MIEIKRQFSAPKREELAKSGVAMPDGSYPIVNSTDLRNAIKAIGRAKDYAATKQHIIKRAKALGLSEILPDEWLPQHAKSVEVPSLEYKDLPINSMRVIDDQEGIVEAIVSVTGIVDSVRDVIKPGACVKSLSTITPKVIWSHSWSDPIAKTLEIRELMPGDPALPKSLYDGSPWPKEAGAVVAKAQFNLNTERGRTAYEDVKFFGTEQSWSIGFRVAKGNATTDTKQNIRYIKELELLEYSPVLWGAMPAARSLPGVKSAQVAYHKLNLDDTEFKTWLDKLNLEVADVPSEFVKTEEDAPVAEAADESADEVSKADENSKAEIDETEVKDEGTEKPIETELIDSEVVISSASMLKVLQTFYDLKELLTSLGLLTKDDVGEPTALELPDSLVTALESPVASFNAASEDDDFEAMSDAADKIMDIVEDVWNTADEETKTNLQELVKAMEEHFTYDDVAEYLEDEELSEDLLDDSKSSESTEDKLVEVDLSILKTFDLDI